MGRKSNLPVLELPEMAALRAFEALPLFFMALSRLPTLFLVVFLLPAAAAATAAAAPQATPPLTVLLAEWMGVFGSEFMGDGLDEAGVEVAFEPGMVPVEELEEMEEEF